MPSGLHHQRPSRHTLVATLLLDVSSDASRVYNQEGEEGPESPHDHARLLGCPPAGAIVRATDGFPL